MSICIAMPLIGDSLSEHFGHAECFAFVNPDQPEQVRRAAPPAHAPGVLPKWLHEQGATVVIAGGMGPRAVDLLKQNGMKVVLGVQPMPVAEVLRAHADGSLRTGEVNCSHGPDHSCSH